LTVFAMHCDVNVLFQTFTSTNFNLIQFKFYFILLFLSTGSVVTPYTRYPTLLDTLLGFLRTEQKLTIRHQTLRLLGLLGALDPYQHKMLMGQVRNFVGERVCFF
jgi:hypothetical protein